ncbi:GH18 family chitinase/lysophospholipase L1-like esterase [Kitasatospora sp. GP30]|uniref:glycosyl hydrolase family 18 protein n=1 Tax=Kitasatospora sp. GP30 TaxID=3035084 RepID=UPI000C706B03|nr:glycosyl hydrolase family 18 protein [Kitasatospora sp. GP30]MDH6144035.1 GH18 family chitinase/lysophospholipase L1-like esterase [Kitasatospora sp. GP30]
MRRPSTIWLTVSLTLSLLLGLVQALLLPAVPASAAVSDYRVAAWNTHARTDQLAVRVPQLMQALDLKLMALQEVRDDALPGDAQQDVTVTDAFSGSGNWNIDVSRWTPVAGGTTYYLYRVQSPDAGNRSVAIITDTLVGADRLMVFKTAQHPEDKKPYSFPAIGLKLGDSWYFSIHATTTPGRGKNNADLIVNDASTVVGRRGDANWAVLGDFNRLPNVNSPGMPKSDTEKAKQRPLNTDINWDPGEVLYATGKATYPASDSELDYGVAKNAAVGYHATMINRKFESDHHPVVFSTDPVDARVCGIPRVPLSALDDGPSCSPERLPATVALGDSYISGEGGRWAGNANTWATGHAWGTDLAAEHCAGPDACGHDLTQVYDDDTSYGGGDTCDRSSASEIAGADIAGVAPEERFNLACSGATTDAVTSSSFKDEDPQITRLAQLAQDYQVKTVVLSVGGNDLNFSGIVAECGKAYLYPLRAHCNSTQEASFASGLSTVQNKVTATLQAVRSTMQQAGYPDGSYTLVLQSYPQALPRSTDNRYRQTLGKRYNSGGCPFNDDDSDWAHDSVIPRISNMLQQAARAGGATFLDLQDAFAGHELCAGAAQQATSANSPTNPLPAAQAEWVRWVPYLKDWTQNLGWQSQGDQQEALHPNAYGQQVLSACLSQLVASSPGADTDFRCTNTPGQGPEGVRVRPGSGRGIDATLSVADNEAYFFHGDKYARVTFDKLNAGSAIVGGADAGIKNIADNWPSLRGTPFADKIDAAFSLPDHKGEAYLFSGNQYIRINNVTPGTTNDTRVNGPWDICTGWTSLCKTPELKALFGNGIDSALSVRDNEVYFFKNDQYVLVQANIGSIDQVLNGPKPIAGNWPSLAAADAKDPTAHFSTKIDTGFGVPEWYCNWFQAIVSLGIQCAISNHPGYAAFFSGGKYAVTSVVPGTTDDKLMFGPTRIRDTWTALRNTIFDDQPDAGTALARSMITGPSPGADGDPNGPGPFSTNPAEQPGCRPDGMTPTDGVNTPYCLRYDNTGRELLGTAHQRRVVGYFTGWRTGKNGQHMYLPSSIPWGQLTHVNYAFGHLDNNQLSVGPDGPDNPATGMTWPGVPGAEMDPTLPYQGNLNLLTKYKKQHPRVRTLISVGGWAETGGALNPDGSRTGNGGLYTLTTNQDGSVNQPAIDTFADSAVAFIRHYGFDGVDIDYEYPDALPNTGNPADWSVSNPRRPGLTAGYTALMKTLRQKLDAAAAADQHYYELTAAGSSSGYLLRGMADNSALQYLDFVNDMSYDFHGSWNRYVGPNAPLYDDGRDAELTAAGIYDTAHNPEYQQEGYFNTDWSYHYYRGALQSGRINVGVPYYTRGWDHVTGGVGNGLWGTSDLPDQSQCPQGTGSNGGTVACGSGAKGVDNLWHDSNPDGTELGAGSNPMWHAKNLERGITPSYLPRYGLDPTDPANQPSGYVRQWDDTLKASWLWNDAKKTFLSTEDEQAISTKAQYVKDNGIGGMTIWELGGDYDCPAQGECAPGYTLTNLIGSTLSGAAPYGNTRADQALPQQTVAVTAQLVNYPTDLADMWPMQPTLRITNNTGSALPAGTQLSFDIPTSTTPLVKDAAWHPMTGVAPGRSGPNTGGLGADFHRVTITLGYCEDIQPGKSRDIGIKYYLPITGPANFTITIGGTQYGLAQDNRQGTTLVQPTAPGSTGCQAEPWDAARTYNPALAPFALWHTGNLWKVQDVNSGNVIDHPGDWTTAHLVDSQAGNGNQLWNVVEDGGTGRYRIKSSTGGHEQCLGADRQLADLSVRDCDLSNGQWWQLFDDQGNRLSGGVPADGKAFSLRSEGGSVAEPFNSGVLPNTRIVAGAGDGSTRTVVSSNGYYWKAKYWTKGNLPDATDPNNAWTRLGPVS